MNGIASFADTGLWRLIITISFSGISAIFKNVDDSEMEPVLLFKKDWNANEDSLLRLVEDAVYDNPRILDDFSTKIILYTPKSLWIPTELTDEEDFDENFFTSVYPAASEDIFADFGDEEVCLYSLVPGLNSFLQRTLPGCQISSHISVIKRSFSDYEFLRGNGMSEEGSRESIYINCRNRELDIFAFKNAHFLSGSTHHWRTPYDIAYKLLLLGKVYKLNHDSLHLHIYGKESVTAEVTTLLKALYANVTVEGVPTLSNNLNIPMATALVAGESLLK